MTEKIDPLYNVDNYAKEARYRLQKAHHEARKLLLKSKQSNKLYYDKNSNNIDIKINDQVYIETQPYDKRKNVNIGPFIIKNITFPNIEIFDPKTNISKIVHQSKIRQ